MNNTFTNIDLRGLPCEQPLLDAMRLLRAACAETSIRHPYRRPSLEVTEPMERKVIRPAYDRARQELARLLKGWGQDGPMLPDFVGGRRTAELIKDLCTKTTREFDPDCSLQDAARMACVIGSLRHVGWELLGKVWSDDSYVWFGSELGPDCYSDFYPFPEALWGIAAGRVDTNDCVCELLADFPQSWFRDDPERRALQSEEEYEDPHVGWMPVRPILAWASTSRVRPHGLEERVAVIRAKRAAETEDSPAFR